MIGPENTVDEGRELIGVPPKVEKANSEILLTVIRGVGEHSETCEFSLKSRPTACPGLPVLT